MKTLTIFSDTISGNQVLYVDDTLQELDETVYGCDLVAAADGEPVLLALRDAELPDDVEWPQSLTELERMLKVWEVWAEMEERMV